MQTRFIVDTGQRWSISPLIYGSNIRMDKIKKFPAYRLGGNRLTGYNWENNMSNAGSDYFHITDDHLVTGLSEEMQQLRAGLLIDFHLRAKFENAYDIVTLPMAGYVATDRSGEVNGDETAPSPRWKASDESVDKCLRFLTRELGKAANGGIKGYMLDNEPALWCETHPRIHPGKATYEEVTTHSARLANMIKMIDEGADVYGLVAFGFSEMLNLRNAPGHEASFNNGSYTWFVDYYLDYMFKASEKAGRRLLDVLDIHWYPEARGISRIIEEGADDPLTVKARLDAPRTLWQPSYLENSWIARDYAGFLPLIPRIQQSISQFFPGTEISFSEVNFGGGNHISGAIAAADYLGIFGKHGIYAAFFWPLTLTNEFISAGYNLYLDYDGEGNSFGTIGVEAGTSDDESSSIYASIKDKDAAQLNLVVLNKSPSVMDAIILINGSRQYSIARITRLEGEHADIRIVTDHTDSGELQIELAPFSASHLVLSGRPE